MSNENEIVEKVHIQSLVNPDPDFLEEKLTLQELIENHIMFQSKDFTDYYKTSDLMLNQIKNILYDSNDDKLGRVRDLFDNEIEGIARFVAEHHKDNNFANWAFNETMKHII